MERESRLRFHAKKRSPVHPDHELVREGEPPVGGGELDLHPQLGDILLSRDALPRADSIRMSEDQPDFNVGPLREYLKFLELIVLNERIVLIKPMFSDDSRRLYEQYSGDFDRYTAAGVLHLELEAEYELKKRKIMREATIRDDSIASPEDFVEQHLPHDEGLQAKLLKHIRRFQTDYDLAEAETLARLELADRYGAPLYLSECARTMQRPYILGDSQIEQLASTERAELESQKTVISVLKEHLDKGPQSELRRLERLGASTVFPETPIAMTIIQNSSSPEGLLEAAIQLRDEYADFRREMADFEDELIREDVTLEKKLKKLRDLENLAKELWPAETFGLRKTATELTGIVGLLPEALAPGGLVAGPGLVQRILELPMDLLLKQLRRRKVREMLKSKRDFLGSRDWSTHLASMFDVPTPVVTAALLEDALGAERR